MISIDDFSPENIKLAKLIKSYGLEKDTWFAIEIDSEEKIEQVIQLALMGFNIASHTDSHAHLSRIPIDDAYFEMSYSKNLLEDKTGQKIDWLVLPRGRGNEEVYKMAKQIGYRYIRTTKLFNESEMIRGGCHLTFPRSEYRGIDPFDWAKKSHLNHYWGHMAELIRFGKLKEFEEFLKWYKDEEQIIK